ncbi:MAG TPA: hypothetical protein VFM98_01835 [Ramlibacter sp.]|uniref:hypothetical protein n=1 Tax=Ramlibacter sp. TaxID=1917967 RepID=UPI002D7FD482|nr:hypothetical protein [Ramlibacter sp.]HET8744316.1 hypothetical protein [Ramlibacter sp.]
MAAKSLITLLPTFHGLDGLPLDGGYVWFGIPGQDPQEFPKTVYFDPDLTVPAGSMLRTTLGFLYRDGSPTTVWADGDVSILVQDAEQQQVWYFSSWSGLADFLPVPVRTVDTFNGTGALGTYTLSVTPASKTETDVYVGGDRQEQSTYTLDGANITGTFAAGSNNVEIVTTTIVDLSGVRADLALFAQSAGDAATAAAASATAADASEAQAAAFAAQAAAIAALIGAGGSALEKLHIHDYSTIGSIATIPDTVVAVTKVYFGALFIGPDTGQYTPATPTSNQVTLAADLGGVSKVYIFYI